MTVFLESLGCAKNQVDAEVMIAALEAGGWQVVQDADAADLILVNTCGFIAPAKQESIDLSLEHAALHPGKPVVMTGCLTQRYAHELESQMPEIAGFIGNRAPARIVEQLQMVLGGQSRIVVGEEPPVEHATAPRRNRLLSLAGSAYVKIAEGCDNRCSFCAIPLIRGQLRSRQPESIRGETRALVDRGVHEINLVAQDLGSYGRDRDADRSSELVPLLRRILEDPRPFWLRLLYIHPERIPDGLIDLVADEPRLLPYFDLPFQHASARVLRTMGRRGDAQQYLSLIDRIRERCPDAVIRSTLLVGFEEEDDAAFAELLEFQQHAELDWLGAFTYSPEEGTPAYTGRSSRRPTRKVAEQRRSELMRLQAPITEQRMRRHIGAELDLLLEEHVESETLSLARCYVQAPEVDGLTVVHEVPGRALQPGTLLRARITAVNGLDLEAVPI